MGFDIFFMSCKRAREEQELIDPFTGKVVSVRPYLPLTAKERNAVRELFRKVKVKGPDEYHCYTVDFSDGGGAEIFGGEKDDGYMVAVRGITPDLLQFLVDLAKAGNMQMLPAVEPALTIVPFPTLAREAVSDSRQVIVCESGKELGTSLDSGFGAWERYRDQVSGRGDK